MCERKCVSDEPLAVLVRTRHTPPLTLHMGFSSESDTTYVYIGKNTLVVVLIHMGGGGGGGGGIPIQGNPIKDPLLSRLAY